MMPLAKAQKIAEHIAGELTPYCDRIEIAGSIRRRRPQVGDIDLVCEPRNRTKFEERVLLNRPVILANGNWNLEVRLENGIRLDLWMAKPSEPGLFETRAGNWGSLFLCRTGSTQHNIHLVGKAKALGLTWNPYWGVFRGPDCIASATEEEIFRALALEFVPPENREI